MLKYNLKDFFKEVIIHNDDWVSNGHFMFKKSILTAGQQKMLEDFPQDTNRIKSLVDVAESTKERFEYSKEKFEFAPDLMFEVEIKGIEGNIKESYSALYNNELDLALREEYYNLFISRGCKIYKGNGSLNPTLIFKDNEFVGILLPIRTALEQRENATSYRDYITQIKQHQEANNELKKLNKKCLYISNNKAVVRNKPLKCIAEIFNDDSFKNLYIDAVPDNQNYVNLYINLDIVCIDANKVMIMDLLENYKEYLSTYINVTLESYITTIKESLSNNRWINIAEIKLIELAGESEELIESIHQHRKNMTRVRLEKQKQDQEYIDSKNKIANNLITTAEQSILKGEKVSNDEITIYEDKWSSNTTSLILHLMKLYDIKVPLRTQGWINKALHSIYKNENNNHYTYNYYNSSSNSTVFSKYLDMLVDKVKEKHELDITA